MGLVAISIVVDCSELKVLAHTRWCANEYEHVRLSLEIAIYTVHTDIAAYSRKENVTWAQFVVVQLKDPPQTQNLC